MAHMADPSTHLLAVTVIKSMKRLKASKRPAIQTENRYMLVLFCTFLALRMHEGHQDNIGYKGDDELHQNYWSISFNPPCNGD